MKKIIALLLSLCVAGSFSAVAFAQSADEEAKDAVISASVPYFHTITADADGAEILFNGETGSIFSVDRLSQPTVIISPDSGRRIKQVLLNGEDITSQVVDGSYTFEPVYEDMMLTVMTETDPDFVPADSSDSGSPDGETDSSDPSGTDSTSDSDKKPDSSSAAVGNSSENPPADNPDTGDIISFTAWIFLLAAALVCTASAIRIRRKRKE